MSLRLVKNFINGEFVECESYIDSYEPSTGSVWAKIPNSSHKDVDSAVNAASQAFDSWSSTTAEHRSGILFRIANLIESQLDEFAELESRDQGKPVWLAKAVDIPRAVHNFRFFASYILHDLNRSCIQEQRGAVQYTVKDPVGVAGLISPWNLPLYLLTFKMAPALATGNTVVAKPSELTSVSAFKLCEVIKEAGVPPGVMNMVFGLGSVAGDSLVSHPRVPLISFTGGTVTAAKIRQTAAGITKKLSMELGGKNAAVVFDDADLDKCIADCIKSSFMNQGEICLCTSRIFVHRNIYKAFLERFVEETNKLKVGDPQEGVFMGALISKDHLAKVRNAVEQARHSGATIHTRNEDIRQALPQKCKEGYFMYPAVISNTPDSSAAMQEEIFGPVTCVVPFDTEEEGINCSVFAYTNHSVHHPCPDHYYQEAYKVVQVVARANGTKYGLCATVWTRDLSRAHRVSRRLQVGTVWVNCWLVRDLNVPFGGVKESGIGREGGLDSVSFFTEEKTICVLV